MHVGSSPHSPDFIHTHTHTTCCCSKTAGVGAVGEIGTSALVERSDSRMAHLRRRFTFQKLTGRSVVLLQVGSKIRHVGTAAAAVVQIICHQPTNASPHSIALIILNLCTYTVAAAAGASEQATSTVLYVTQLDTFIKGDELTAHFRCWGCWGEISAGDKICQPGSSAQSSQARHSLLA